MGACMKPVDRDLEFSNFFAELATIPDLDELSKFGHDYISDKFRRLYPPSKSVTLKQLHSLCRNVIAKIVHGFPVQLPDFNTQYKLDRASRRLLPAADCSSDYLSDFHRLVQPGALFSFESCSRCGAIFVLSRRSQRFCSGPCQQGNVNDLRRGKRKKYFRERYQHLRVVSSV